MYKKCFTILFLFFCKIAFSQDATTLINQVKAKIETVKDYTATGKMKTDVAFIKAPVGNVKVFFKQPNKFKIQRDKGISILPKGGVSVSLNSIVAAEDFIALHAGMAKVGGINTAVIKLIPTNDKADVVLTTMYIDEERLLIKKAITTTKENGTYEMEMFYDKYEKYGLPDKVIFQFNTKDYKLPKGVTLEFDEVDAATKAKMKSKKGRVEITYNSYAINQGISDAIFK